MMELNSKKLIHVGMYYQRNLVSAWMKPEKRDALIDTINRGWNFQAMHCCELESGVIQLMDGKQRFNTLCDWISGNYVPQTGEFEGRAFPMLVQDEKDKILNYPMVLITYKESELSDDEKIILFERLQKGIPLTATQAKRGQYVNKLLPTGIIEMMDIRIEPDKEIFGSMARESMALQLFDLAMNTAPDFKGTGHIDSFISGDIRQHIETIKAKLTTFKAVLALMATDTEYKMSYKRILKKIHAVTIAHLMPAKANEKILDELNNSLVKFFSETSSQTKDENRKAYLTASASDSASKDQISKRLECLKLALTMHKTKPPKPQPEESEPEPEKTRLPNSEQKLNADKAKMIEDQKAYDEKKKKNEEKRKENDKLIQTEIEQLNAALPEGETIPGQSPFDNPPPTKPGLTIPATLK